ncbi:hypothetical protein [Sediminicola arcticus]|jgi:hypothetical protein|uniref:ASCH domain-containing protein n=1 Tax=Sediminicola arcticus TaxID=1574308 RepID=A0ABV2SUF0_9FLAO
MYISKVWIHKSVEELSNNSGRFWINYTFLNEPKAGDIIKVTNEMAEDIADKELWKREYGPGNYIVQTVANIFDEKIHDEFSFCLMILKEK